MSTPQASWRRLAIPRAPVVPQASYRLVSLHRSLSCVTCRNYLECLHAERDGFDANALESVPIECSTADGNTTDESEALCKALDLPALLIPMWREYLRPCADGQGDADACVPGIFLVTPERTLFACTGNGGLPTAASIFAATASLRRSRVAAPARDVPAAGEVSAQRLDARPLH